VKEENQLEQILQIILHDFSTPLANIDALCKNLKKESLSKSDFEKSISYLGTSSAKLQELLGDLNTIFKMTKQGSEFKEPVSLNAVVSSIKTLLGQPAIEQTIINTDFKEIETFVSVKSYIHSILYNLVSNSVKFRKKNDSPAIQITSRRKGNDLLLIYTDNGRGIDLALYGDEIYGLFKRFHEDAEGKGMGLFMVKKQVELLNGKIEIKSKVNDGTEFRITLPLD
jgi:light-regulated signal transduction histidine kinase (bacteriophytochrome)